MNEQQPYPQPQPTPPLQSQPLPPQPTPEQEAQRKLSNKRKLIWGLVCLIGPTVLLIGTIMAYAITNFIAAGSSDGGMSGAEDTVRTIFNIVSFLVGAVVVLTWLPGIIVGIVLLATRR